MHVEDGELWRDISRMCVIAGPQKKIKKNVLNLVSRIRR